MYKLIYCKDDEDVIQMNKLHRKHILDRLYLLFTDTSRSFIVFVKRM